MNPLVVVGLAVGALFVVLLGIGFIIGYRGGTVDAGAYYQRKRDERASRSKQSEKQSEK